LNWAKPPKGGDAKSSVYGLLAILHKILG